MAVVEDAMVGVAVGAVAAGAAVGVLIVTAVGIVVVTSAAYTIFGVRQRPSKGHTAGVRQLHLRVSGFSGLIIF